MSVVFPSEAIARRWNGALQKSLRRAPLEQFLRSNRLKLSPPGAVQITDNLCRATLHIIETGLGGPDIQLDFTAPQQYYAGSIACAVSHGLTLSIGELSSWRVVALVCVNQMFAPRLGCVAAAKLASSAVHDYYRTNVAKQTGRTDLRYVRLAAERVFEAQQTTELEALINDSFAEHPARRAGP